MVLPGGNVNNANSGRSPWWQPSQQNSSSSSTKSSAPASLAGLLKWRVFPILIIASFLGILVTFLYTHTSGWTIYGNAFTTHVENVIEAQVLHTNLGGNNFEHRYFLFDSELEEDVEIGWYRSWKSLFRPATLMELLAATAITQDPKYIRAIEAGFSEGIELLYDFTTEMKRHKGLKKRQNVLAALEPEFRMLSYSFASAKWVRQSFRGKQERVEQDKLDRFRATYHFLEHTGMGEIQMLQEHIIPRGQKRESCLNLAMYIFINDVLNSFEEKKKSSGEYEEEEEEEENVFLSTVFYSWLNNGCERYANMDMKSDYTSVLDSLIHTVVNDCTDADDFSTCGARFRKVFPKSVEKILPTAKNYLSGCDAGMMLILSQEFSQSAANTLASLIRSHLTPEGLICNVEGHGLIFPLFQQRLQERLSTILGSQERSTLEGATSAMRSVLHGLRQRKYFPDYPVFVKVSSSRTNSKQLDCLWCKWYLQSVPDKIGQPLIQSLSQPLMFNVTTRFGPRKEAGQQSVGPSINVPNLSAHLHSRALGMKMANLTSRGPSIKERKQSGGKDWGLDVASLLVGLPPADFLQQWRQGEIQLSNLQNLEGCEAGTVEWYNCDGSRAIACDKLNDGFCDCPSTGADEPSTSACSQNSIPKSLRMKSKFVLGHHFWCKGGVSKEKYSRSVSSIQDALGAPSDNPLCEPFDEPLPQAYKTTGGFDPRNFIIPSSKVEDGICDCVYGEDEREVDYDLP
eukprot:gb/GECG01016039.1/.p1 GENE.gb/GECG01016039.1/~~gb/GECG01016039.1/.p1  ORF type:complete len:741 (+),score=86.04 gb/GECG01016039.1/:1-2223(+)